MRLKSSNGTRQTKLTEPPWQSWIYLQENPDVPDSNASCMEDFLKRILILCEGDDCLDASKLPLAAADAVVAAFCASPEYLEQLSFHGAHQCLSLKDLSLRYRE